MSIKDLIKDPATWAVPITALIGWLLGRAKQKADNRKSTIEADSAYIDVRVKENAYEAGKYENLLKRFISLEEAIHALRKDMKIMSDKLEASLITNTELRAELTLYKTIK